MHPRHRFLPSVFAAFFLAGVISQAASCTLDTGGLTEPSVQPQPCNVDANCNDEDQCTVNLCGANKTCEFKPVDGLAPEQIAGDCQLGSCTNGVLTQSADDADLPDDLESCTTDMCANGKVQRENLADESPCLSGDSAGLCKAGKCTVECGPKKPCNDGNPCTEDTCNASTGTCSFAALDGLLTPDFKPIVGDCSQQICVNGKSTAIADDADLPDDMNLCTKDGCSMGTKTHTPVNVGAPCLEGGSGICDSGGKCLECINVADCPPLAVDNGCHMRTCTANKCGDALAPSGTEVPSMLGDCKQTFCDNAGNAVVQNSMTDVYEDNNPCTKNVCNNGMPTNPNEPANTDCGGGLKCNATGQCEGCATAANCPGMDDFCKTRTCTNMKCGFDFTAAGTDLPTGQMAADCKVNECDGMGNTISSVDTVDIFDDMNDCTLDSCNPMGVPVNALKPLNASCNQNGGTACNSLGMCLDALGAACMDGTECAAGFCTDGVCCAGTCTGECMSCNVTGTAGTCSNVPANSDDAPVCIGTNSCDGMGACKRDDGQPCGANVDCSSGFCADGVCCNSACGDTCKSCNLAGNVGVCTLVPNDTVDPTGPAPCNNPYRCDGTGLCKGLNSVTCTQPSNCLSGYCVDGYCCGGICDQLCKSCAGAITGGSNGACLSVLNGTDPANECPNSDCNGNGACTGLPPILGINGASCSSAGQCLSGFCADGVCCNAGCSESCKTCNKAGSVGTCVNVPNDTVDNTATTPCQNAYRCDGNGACKALNSVPCMTAGQCLSGYCVDGFCCNLICNGLCRSCASTLNAGADGTCGFTKAGIDPDNECAGNCNGAGVCIP